MVAHIFNPTLRWQRQVGLCEFETSLMCIASSKLARDPVSNKQTPCGVEVLGCEKEKENITMKPISHTTDTHQ